MQDECSDIGSTETIVYDDDAVSMLHSNQVSRESWKEVLQADAGRRQKAVAFSRKIVWDMDTGYGEVRGINFQESHWDNDDASVPDLVPSSSPSIHLPIRQGVSK